MTAVGEIDSALATKCLDFCQTLCSQGFDFKFSLSMGSSFSFSVDTKGKDLVLDTKSRTKKKPSPSTLRRNARRRNEFLKKKQSEQVSVNEADLQTPEKGRSPGAILDLNLTPVNCKGRVDADSHPSPPSSPSGASIPSPEQEKEDIPEVVLREGDGALVLSKKYSTPPAKVKHPFNGLLSFQWRSGKDGSFYYVGKGTPVKVFNPA